MLLKYTKGDRFLVFNTNNVQIVEIKSLPIKILIFQQYSANLYKIVTKQIVIIVLDVIFALLLFFQKDFDDVFVKYSIWFFFTRYESSEGSLQAS